MNWIEKINDILFIFLYLMFGFRWECKTRISGPSNTTSHILESNLLDYRSMMKRLGAGSRYALISLDASVFFFVWLLLLFFIPTYFSSGR